MHMRSVRRACNTLKRGLTLSGLIWALGTGNASAVYFPLGFGSAGKPDSWAIENYTFFSQIGGNTQQVGDIGELAYFTKTGFTGSSRDQFELYGFFSGGYVGAPGDHGAGIGHPELGLEYYYQVIQPKVTAANADSSDYVTFWTSPNVQVNFPNGYSGASSYSAGANQYQFNANLQNYYRNGKFAVTFVPVFATYGFANQNTTSVTGAAGIVQSVNARGGWSISTAIFNAGYHLTDDLWVGVYHTLNFNNVSDSFPHVATTTEATIGPQVEYDGLGPKYNLYIQGTIQTDYYRSSALKQNTSFILYFFKYISPDEPTTVTAKY